MKTAVALLCVLALAFTGHAAEPVQSTVNSIGIEFVRVPAGHFIYGRFEPPFPAGGAAASGMTPAQMAAVTRMNDALVVADQAVGTARTALVTASLDGTPRTQLDAKAKTLATRNPHLRSRGRTRLAPPTICRPCECPQVATLCNRRPHPPVRPGPRGGADGANRGHR